MVLSVLSQYFADMKTTFKTAWKIRNMSDNEFIAYLQRKDAAERHILLLCDLRVHFERASRHDKSVAQTWDFESDYKSLKNYMKIHSWSKEFVRQTFGVDFKAMTKLYFSLCG